jgi:hypothetical protein
MRSIRSDMLRQLFIAAFAFLIPGAALAQSKPTLNRAAEAMIGKWEFSNADHNRTCMLELKGDAVAVGHKLEFDATCAAQFPLVRDIIAWKYPDDDLLYLLDAQGKALIEFSEVEDGLFEAPTRGVGVLFLQNPATVGPPPKTAEDVAGDWALKLGTDAALCTFTLATKPVKDAFVLMAKPGCNAAVTQLKFAQWRMDRGELLLIPAKDEPWRFTEGDDGNWHRLPERPNGMMLVKP